MSNQTKQPPQQQLRRVVAFLEPLVSASIEAPSNYCLSESQRQLLWVTEEEQIQCRVATRMLVRKSKKKDQRQQQRRMSCSDMTYGTTDSMEEDDSLRGLECHLNKRRCQVKRQNIHSILLFQSQLFNTTHKTIGKNEDGDDEERPKLLPPQLLLDATTLLGDFCAQTNKEAVLQGILMATKDRAQANHVYYQETCSTSAAAAAASSSCDNETNKQLLDRYLSTADSRRHSKCSRRLSAVPSNQKAAMKEAVARTA